MAEDKITTISNSDNFNKLLDKDEFRVPQVGDNVKGTVLSASKAEVRLDIGGILTGIVRGQELYEEGKEYADLKPGDEIEATVVEEENENGELELSFRHAGQAKAMADLKDAYDNKKIIKVKVAGANRGGLVANFGQIAGFLPVSQLSPENYPRVSGGDKSKILEKLKSFVGQELEVKVINIDESEKEERIIFSEKDVWSEKQKDTISKYKVGAIVEGVITAVTDFGVFVGFDDNLEGLVHISELAWQRIDNPADLFKAGDKIKAEIINVSGSKIFLSAKKLMKDPWEKIEERYKIGQAIKGAILKVNPFGLFIKLDDDIHGLAHVSQLNLAPGQKISDAFKTGEQRDFTINSIEAKDHRLGLVPAATLKSEGDKETSAVKAPVEKEKKTKAVKISKEDKTSAGKEKETHEKKPKRKKTKS
ncbi:S1 RNA-binding domain-containing protein [Candidatus Falkowbacteria bacterium]|nr:S1 RNA-binding domain-containing protein [Candidatus Falkowbacteria bacterium]